MSSASGEMPVLSLPTQPKDMTNQEAVTRWLVMVQYAINNWANLLINKISEIEQISKNGEGLDIPMFTANATVTKSDGTIVMFADDPEVLGRGYGLYRYNSTTSTWDKL